MLIRCVSMMTFQSRKRRPQIKKVQVKIRKLCQKIAAIVFLFLVILFWLVADVFGPEISSWKRSDGHAPEAWFHNYCVSMTSRMDRKR